MKRNNPVTENEVLLPDTTVLITRTDKNGKIIFANDSFIEISGFTAEELMGASHNIVRHPDMPAEAFKDLWATIKQGKPWRQLVKNKTKSGDYYWVDANVIPILKDSQIDSYLSVRYSPSRDQIREAEAFYEKLRQQKVTIKPTGILHKLNFNKRLSIKSKLIFTSIVFLIPSLLSTILLINEKDIVIDFAQQEVIGAEYHLPLTQLITETGELSGLASQKTKQPSSAALEQARHSIESLIATIDTNDSKYGELLKTTESWRNLKQNWLAVSTALPPQLSPEDAYARQSKFTESIYSFISEVNDNSNLILDPDLDSFWLMDMTSVKLPELLERLAFLRNYVALNYVGQPLNDNQKIELMVKYRLAQRLFDKVTESAAKTSKFNAIVAEDINKERTGFETFVQQYLTDIRLNLIENKENTIPADQYYNNGTQAIKAANSLYDTGSKSLKKLLEVRVSKIEHEKWVQLTLVISITLFAITIGFFVIRYVLNSLKTINGVFNQIINDNFKNHINLDVEDEFGNLLRALQNLQVQLFANINEVKSQAEKTLILKQALDNVQSCVMVANTNHDIIYLNPAMHKLFQSVQADFRTQLTNFDADKLIGVNIDTFHQAPAHQRNILNNLSGTFDSSLIIGGRHLRLTVKPIRNEEDRSIGTVVQWTDKTQEVKIEQEIESIVDAVKNGILSNRINLSDKHGFYEKLSIGINALSADIENVIKDIGSTMQSMAEGDLTNRITRDYQGVYLECKTDINTTLDKLSEIFAQISESAHFIHNSTQEIASGNNNLSQRAEQQASNLEETAASMEELTGTVKNNASNAQQANLVANNARELAENGGKVVKAAVSSMQEINASSNKIADIIGVIDEIAFQTNLLALNASVEAARAGEQGRGFSVVATEVRNLAQRSATAAKESKELIENSVQKVRSGTEFVNETGRALTEIMAGVKKVGDIVAEIAAASIEQSTGIAQVNQAVSQMDELTQQNAALAEQASAASVSMSDLSTNMVELLTFFKTDNTVIENHSMNAKLGVKPPTVKAEPTKHLTPTVFKQTSQPAISDDDWQDF
jgi:methyl-accepting chemotaxis protein